MTGNDNIKEVLKTRGYKLTRQREAILESFINCDSHIVTAYDIFKQVMLVLPRTNISTIYRNLEMMFEEGILSKVSGQDNTQAYELNINADHHHHLICKICGGVQCLDFCPIDVISEKHGFTHTEHRLEIYGFCSKCAKMQTT